MLALNNYTQVESVGWFSRIMDAIKGVLVGVIFFAVSFPLLFWNEGRAVHRAQDLEEGRGAVVEANAASIDASHEGKLVHLTGNTTSTEALVDNELGPGATGVVRLRRIVEMFQWAEESHTSTTSNTGGSQTRRTTYSYSLAWSSSAVDSSAFHQPDDHTNPPMPLRSQDFESRSVTLGARTLSPALVAQMQGAQPLPVQPAAVHGLPSMGRTVTPYQGGFYVGANPAQPSLGDLRVRWEVAPVGPVSVLAAQQGATFADWHTPSGRTLEPNLEAGTVGAAQMFGNLEAGNEVIAWVLRFVGWLLMFLGVVLVTRPLVVVADVLPFAGSLVGAGAGFVAFVIASPLSLLTVAVAWIVYRPLLGAALLVAGVGVAVAFGKLAASRGREKNTLRASQRATA